MRVRVLIDEKNDLMLTEIYAQLADRRASFQRRHIEVFLCRQWIT